MIIFALTDDQTKLLSWHIGAIEERKDIRRVGDLVIAANLVPGWAVARAPGRKYLVWRPEDRDPSVPWALGPHSVSLTRKQLENYLREHGWPADARAHLEQESLNEVEIEERAKMLAEEQRDAEANGPERDRDPSDGGS